MRRLVSFVAASLVFGCASLAAPAISDATPPTCAQGGLCTVGDIGPGGGYIIFVKSTGAFSASAIWSSPVTVSLTAEQQEALDFEYIEAFVPVGVTQVWQQGGSTTVSGLDSLIGTGNTNTLNILSTVGTFPAAAYAYSSGEGGQSDWRLASLDELKLFAIRSKEAITPYVSQYTYWSSTQGTSFTAKSFNYTSGATGSSSRASQFRMVLVRYLSPPAQPTLTSASPSSGGTAGGASVVLTGTGLQDVASVMFGGTSATFSVDSPTQITATTPPHSVGAVEVTVTNTIEQSSILSAAYTYVAPPQPQPPAPEPMPTPVIPQPDVPSVSVKQQLRSILSGMPDHVSPHGRTVLIKELDPTIHANVRFRYRPALIPTADLPFRRNRAFYFDSGGVAVEMHRVPVKMTVTLRTLHQGETTSAHRNYRVR